MRRENENCLQRASSDVVSRVACVMLQRMTSEPTQHPPDDSPGTPRPDRKKSMVYVATMAQKKERHVSTRYQKDAPSSIANNTPPAALIDV